MILKKIVIAPDSFKGSLSAAEVAECCAKAVKSVDPQIATEEIPLADGGEGTVEVLAKVFGGATRSVTVQGPLGKPLTARYLISDDGSEALMELASAAGLCLLEEGERNPLLTSTYGVGEMIMDAVSQGCRKIYMGIGGSATNDGGMGMLRALGFVFSDKAGNELSGRGADLESVAHIDRRNVDPRVMSAHFIVACDVDNPLTGERGAAEVFAPQKGADREMTARLDKGMCNFADVAERELGKEFRTEPGSGAAGGTGGAFLAFLDAELRPGIDMVLDAVGFDDRLADADLVLTGEGSIDRQSLMGKVVSGVLARASARGVPVVGLAGNVIDSDELESSGFTAIFPIVSGPVSVADAMDKNNAVRNLSRTVRQIVSFAMMR